MKYLKMADRQFRICGSSCRNSSAEGAGDIAGYDMRRWVSEHKDLQAGLHYLRNQLVRWTANRGGSRKALDRSGEAQKSRRLLITK